MRRILIGGAFLAGLASALPMQSQAQDLELNLGRDGLRIERDCNPRYENCRGERREWRDESPRCTEGRALGKAERMGIRRARIADAGRRTIEVSGRNRHGERIYVAFGRQPSCPVLS